MSNFVTYDMDFDEYLDSPGISNSAISIFNECPRKYINGAGIEETPAMKFGSAVHAACIEPERFEEIYVRSESNDKRTTLWKKEAAFCEENRKILLKKDEYDRCLAIKDRIFDESRPECRPTLEILGGENTKFEASIFWEDEDTGLQCKGRIDVLNPEYLCIADLKTTECAEPKSFMSKSAFNYHYHRQMAFYLDGINKCMDDEYSKALIFCLEKSAPYEFSVICMGEFELELGRREYKKALQEIKKCKDEDFWPTYGSESAIVMGNFPTWAFKGHDDLLGLAIERQELNNANENN